MNVADVLDGSVDLLQKSGKAIGELYSDGSYCMLGAIDKASDYFDWARNDKRVIMSLPVSSVTNDATEYMIEFIKANSEHRDITTFSDNNDTDTCIWAFRLAAVQWRKENLNG